MIDIEEFLSAPSTVGVHSTLALTGNQPELPPTPKNSNEPGLERTSIFGVFSRTPNNAASGGIGMKAHHWLFWLVILVLAIVLWNQFS